MQDMQKARLFFVLGAPKSGTTWLQRLLDAHPSVRCTGEGAFHTFLTALQRAAGLYNKHLAARNDIFGEPAFAPLGQGEVARLARAFIIQRIQTTGPVPAGQTLRWIGNKDPDHGVNMASMVRLFPRAGFIHIVRDGRDHLISLRRHMQRHHPNYKPERFADLATMVKERAPEWAAYIRTVRKHAAAAGVAYHELRYEDLVTQPEVTTRKILAFLDVEASAETVAACLGAGDFRRLSGGRAPGEEDPQSFFRKGIAGDWRNHMDPELSAAFCRATGGLMAELGYVQGSEATAAGASAA
jgi:LPS sulfotransferase NodH